MLAPIPRATAGAGAPSLPDRLCSSSTVRAGQTGHESPKVRVPEHVHLLFLPPHSPELQPAEHLLVSEPLTNTVLVNRHFTSIEEVEDAQAERCVALQARPDLIRSTTRFSWWPQRIHRRHGPKRG